MNTMEKGNIGMSSGVGQIFFRPQSGFVVNLEDELENSRFILEKNIQRAEELSVENSRLTKQVEELSKRNGELHEKYVEISQEMEEQRIDLHVRLSSLSVSQKFLEEKTMSLQREMDRRTLVSEEEKISLERKVRELEIALESSRAMEKEKERRIVDLQNQLLESAEAKTCLEKKDNEESHLLVNEKLKKDFEFKDVDETENGKQICVHESENRTSKQVFKLTIRNQEAQRPWWW